jgi:nitroreductase
MLDNRKILMTAIELLMTRQSCANVTEPAPNQADLEQILHAGMRVPDHANLSPWQFTVVTGQGLQHLTDIFTRAASAANMSEQQQAKAQTMAFRAPMILVVSSKFQQHDKVPKQEQLVAAGCAAHAMQMAAFALGYGAMWRTGDFAYNSVVKQGLNISLQDEIIGFLYLGTPVKIQPIKPSKAIAPFVRYLK